MLNSSRVKTMKSLQDVQVFIDTLVATDMLWHADDLVSDIPSFAGLTNAPALQELMNEALSVCATHKCSIFGFYPEAE